MNDVKLTQDELQAIKEREARLVSEKWYYDGETITESSHGNPVITANNWGDIQMAPVVGEFIAHARQDISQLVAEVERLREAIDNAISLLPDGENRLANRRLCEALGVDEDHYGFFSGGESD